MNILMAAAVDPTIPNASITHLNGIATAFAEMGHDVTLVLPQALNGPAALNPATQRPFRIEYVGYGQEFGVPRFASFVTLMPRIIKQCRQGRYDLVYIRSSVLSWVLAAGIRMLTRIPVVTEHNGWISDELKMQGRPRWTQAIMQRFQIWDASLSTKARCVTAGLARALEAHGTPRSKLMVAGNGTNLTQFRPMDRKASLAALNLPEENFYFGFIGSLARWHGLTVAISAMAPICATHDKARFIVAGDGSDRKPAEQMAQKLGIADRIHFLGHVPADQAPVVVNCFDLALAPFITERNSTIGISALKIRDYAAAGRAILSTDIEGVAPIDDRDWIAICPPDDPGALAASAITLMNNAAERERLGYAARSYAEKHFSWTGIAQKILAGL